MVRRCAGCDSRAGTGKTFATAEVGSIDWYVFTDAVFGLVLAKGPTATCTPPAWVDV